MTDDYEVYLMHYGVKGMRWGVRRTSTSATGGGKSGSGRKPLTPEQKAAFRKATAKTGLVVAGLAAGPVALALGGGPAGAIIASTSMRLINSPEVQGALKEAGKYGKDLASNVNFDAVKNLKPNVDMRKMFGSDVTFKDINGKEIKLTNDRATVDKFFGGSDTAGKPVSDTAARGLLMERFLGANGRPSTLREQVNADYEATLRDLEIQRLNNPVTRTVDKIPGVRDAGEKVTEFLMKPAILKRP